VRWLILTLALLLSACHGEGDRRPAAPALWQVAGPHGERGWLFGTVHALPPGLAWETPAIDAALAGADRLVLEIAEPGDGAAARRAFLRLAATAGQPPLAERLPPRLRPQAARLAADAGLDRQASRRLEDWAVALTLARAGDRQAGRSTAAGVEPGLRRRARGLPLVGLETAAGQLGLFDRLDGAAQRALLAAVVAESADRGLAERLIGAWARGDVAAIADEASRGLLADPRLRAALLVERNRRWAGGIEAMLRADGRPFVAVGAAHLAGADGLPALLAARGWTVRRVQ